MWNIIHTNSPGIKLSGRKGYFRDERDGTLYKTIKIGNQTWMAENLNYGSMASETKICYSNNESNCDTYGALYTWAMAMDLDSSCDTTDCSAQIETPHQGICPEGWHLPTDAELKELEMELGMSEAEANSTGWRGTNEGSKLAGNETLWGETRTIVTTPGFNDSGFMGLPAGNRSTDGSSFNLLGVHTYWWSSSQSSATYSWRRYLSRDYSDVFRLTFNKLYGFSVRCLRD
jgi:uncharacterized protein (TIGR02145 family)